MRAEHRPHSPTPHHAIPGSHRHPRSHGECFTLPRWLPLCLGVAALLSPLAASARQVTDMIGRQIEVPENIERVLSTSPPLATLLYSLAPEKLVGLNLPLRPGDERYLPASLWELPVVGSVLGHGPALNAETVLQLRPDVALAWSGETAGAVDVEQVISQFEKTGVPVFFIDLDRLEQWPAAFETLGELLGRQARAATLAEAIHKALREVSQAVDALPEAQRPRVYYAEGADGLSTECHDSFHVEPIALAGGHNVHRCTPGSVMGMEKVSLEQVLAYDPEFIVAQDPAFLSRLGNAGGAWRNVRAVREGRILTVPRTPLNWLDRPPSFMRALGIQWLAGQFHPQRFPFDPRRTTGEFYRLFFGVSPDESDLDSLLTPRVTLSDPPHAHR
ncbi:ABC transporter substrate-binding protein [Stutzerimonas stutzeri]|uniref:ABC transporter substrate-binding protein n=1 Tax=Stutzerimonas stutzeri TaxID=316 RepID=UPI00224435F9|nr:ABC transporter substrate-binding protein [Stutzerimonas stutzeri]MCW8159474.1 ABC transporter substrate-binding protein [Stutzerimonas stutzeri]